MNSLSHPVPGTIVTPEFAIASSSWYGGRTDGGRTDDSRTDSRRTEGGRTDGERTSTIPSRALVGPA